MTNTQRFIAWAACVAVVLTAASASAQDNQKLVKFNEAMQSAAKSIQRLLADQNDSRVRLGDFDAGNSLPGASGGRAMKTALSTELGKMGVTMTDQARFEVRAEYNFDPTDGVLAVEMDFVERPFGLVRSRVRKDVDVVVSDLEEILSLAGGSGTLSVASIGERGADLVNAVAKPQVAVLEAPVTAPAANVKQPVQLVAATVKTIPSRITVSQTSPYGVELGLIDASGQFQPLPAATEGGFAFVGLTPGAQYAIRLFNATPQRAAVKISIDGLNLFHFSDIGAYRDLGRVIIPGGPQGQKGVVIKGWHKTNDFSFSFLVGNKAESLALRAKNGPALLPSDESFGTITVAFAVALAPNEPVPADEFIRPKGDLATILGPGFAAKFREEFVKVLSDREVISIRYDR